MSNLTAQTYVHDFVNHEYLVVSGGTYGVEKKA
jgi:hypothetical protein